MDPLLRIAAGVITEAGGVLSHAAIVPREPGIPAVLGVPRAMALIDDGAAVTIEAPPAPSSPTVPVFNEMSHLPADLRWTRIAGPARP